jgi:pyruvate/2-oxoglutarate dehydrogenase complex dihydrolipoamide acyltransferase (E2) component
MQRLSKFVETSQVLEWLKSPGEAVQEGEILLTVESDKATVEIPSPTSGILLNIVVEAGAEAPAGAVLAWIGQPGEEPPTQETASLQTDVIAPAQPKPMDRSRSQIKAVPAARRLAAQHGVILNELIGSGPGGIVTTSDIERVLARRQAHVEGAPAAHAGMSEEEPETTIIPLDGLTRGMAQRMTASHQNIVQATTVADVDMTEVVQLRERIPVSYTTFVIKASAQAVPEFPLVNAMLEKGRIVLQRHVHMGVAVATEGGLLVPVIRHVERKALIQIDQELKGLARRARERTLKSSELNEPTMSVTNSGVWGSLLFTPIVVLPQSVTLGMGKVASTPVVREDQIVIRDVMYLCLSYDHRLVDGATAVRYLQRVRSFLEHPTLLLDDSDEGM